MCKKGTDPPNDYKTPKRKHRVKEGKRLFLTERGEYYRGNFSTSC